ncbi:MAG: hypothetical protein COA78_13725 [Blastopirellula sp.]|nr:MAG: hypothetical protein COA78_13725 [Blastopirellula sp.]
MYPKEYFDTYWRPEIRNEVFIAMPFHDEFTPIWERALKPAIEEDNDLDLIAYRVDSSNLSGSIVTEILDRIAHARIFLADISISREGKWKGQRNGNVMYEVGLAHAIKQVTETILIRSDNQDINFDIAGINIHSYDSMDLSKSRNKIGELVVDTCTQIDQCKSLKVQRAIDMLDSSTLEILYKSGTTIGFKGRSDASLNGLKYSMAESILQREGIVRCIHGNNFDNIEFHYTDFGVAVLRKLGVRT